MGSFGIYIHVPFCRDAKCPYCDFYSVPFSPDKIKEFLGALELEIDFFSRERAFKLQVDTVYFGGGTPSLLEAEAVQRILARIAKLWSFSPKPEVTLECNPEDLASARLKGYKEAGVTRLSVGCQSFDDRVLSALGRRHSARLARQSLELASEAGFASLSADLILGSPDSSAGSLLRSLDTALACGSDHLSIYGYHLEETCPAYGRDAFREVSDTLYREQYLAACSRLAGPGWLHYEISNWAALAETRCRHNLGYWHRQPYLGCGPSAHSFLPPHTRTWNLPDLNLYLESVRKNGKAVSGAESLSADQVTVEKLMLGLRLSGGAALPLVREAAGGDADLLIGALERQKLARVDRNENFILTDQGWLLYDSILGRLTRGLGVYA